METLIGLLDEIVAGLFGLAGIYLGYRLNRKKQTEQEGPGHNSPRARHASNAQTNKASAAKIRTPKTLTPGEERMIRSFAMSSDEEALRTAAGAVIASLLVFGSLCLTVTIVQSAFASIGFDLPSYVFGQTKVGRATIVHEGKWPAIVFVALLWGIVYASYAVNTYHRGLRFWLMLLKAPLVTYGDIFAPRGPARFVGALLYSFPLNLIVTWTLANLLGLLSAYIFRPLFGLVVMLMFVALTIFAIFLMGRLYPEQ